MLFASAQDLGTAIGTSSATVVRTLQKLGLGGLSAFKRDVAEDFSSEVAPEVRLRQRISKVGHDLSGIRERVYAEAAERVEHGRTQIDLEAFDHAVHVVAGAGEVFAYGVGASELPARHLALKLGRMGRRARFVGSTGFTLADDLLALSRDAVVVAYVPGRLLRDLEVLLERAKLVGAPVVVVTDELAQRLAGDADVILSAPHTPTGITAEALTGIVLTDALLLALASLDETRSVEYSHQLTVLRGRLLENGKPRRQ
jgi:DNA-binding MurR/RpiR family transcriptional regulator